MQNNYVEQTLAAASKAWFTLERRVDKDALISVISISFVITTRSISEKAAFMLPIVVCAEIADKLVEPESTSADPRIYAQTKTIIIMLQKI